MENLSNIGEIIGSLLKIDDEIKTFSEKQKILRKKRDLLEEMVLKTLNENKLTEKKFILNNNAIYCTKSNTTITKCNLWFPLNINFCCFVWNYKYFISLSL